MNRKIKLLPGLIALMLVNFSYAQKVLKPFPKNTWYVDVTSTTFRKSINYLPGGGAVVAADFNKGDCGAARIDEKGKTLWEYKVKGEVVGISRINNNSVMFYSNKETKTGAFSMKNTLVSSTVRAAIINNENGKLVKDILMYDNGKRIIINNRSLNRPDGTLASLFVRVSNSDGYETSSKKKTEKTLTSSKILIISIDDNFNSKPIEIKSPGQEGLFAAAEVGANDDLYFCYTLDDQLVTERFNSSGKLMNKLSTAFPIRTNRDFEVFTTTDAKNPTSLFIMADYTTDDKDQVNQAFEFNFVQNKVTGTGEQELNKAYLKSFDVTEIKELRNTYKASDMEEYRLLNFLVSDDRIVIIKGYISSITNGNTKATHYQSGRVAIEIFDRNWKKLKGIALDRRFELFEPVCRSVGVTITNGKLYTILPAFSGFARLETLYAQIDLKELKVDKYVILDNPYTSRSARGPVVESDASIWLKDGVLMENCGDESGFFSSKTNVSSFWQKLEY